MLASLDNNNISFQTDRSLNPKPNSFSFLSFVILKRCFQNIPVCFGQRNVFFFTTTPNALNILIKKISAQLTGKINYSHYFRYLK